ncbi:unnamed protein product [Microthlaspi erraticum]|uniref:Glabrous enhancer-binding protein-like C-terminal domain-containing protein n=1 Tax=Microthlaspi erraticum TaxID=1685480 RepID=A0A6D2KKM1_9BRAS|nr:unnamed protein product [Microthlaspi erraticum]
MAKKQKKPVEQNETEQDFTAVEKSEGKQKELVKAPSSSPTASAAADPDSIPENKNAETSSAVTSRKTKKKKKKQQLPIEEEEPEGTHEQERLVFQTPTHSPSLAIAETETQETQETESKKRPLEGGSPSAGDVDTKRVKTEENTNLRFQRVWTEQDEIVLLQEIKSFGSDPLKSRKRRRSKKKKIFRTPHKKILHEMAKEIWGSSVEEEEEKKKTHGDEGWFEKSFLLGSIASFGLGEKGVKEGWSLVSAEKKEKIREELRLSVAEEIKSMMRKSRLVSEAMSMIADATS